jgi:hypothetical protein
LPPNNQQWVAEAEEAARGPKLVNNRSGITLYVAHSLPNQRAHTHTPQTLSDFKSRSCGTILSYCWLWILVFTSIIVYGLDTFTAYKLIRLKGWTSEYKPPIPLDIARWIFVGCIIASWVLVMYSWIRALRVMRNGCVTEDYLDPMAVILQSIRWGGGWKRFLVFAELTKSKKKVSWIALFVYFQRKGKACPNTYPLPRQC